MDTTIEYLNELGLALTRTSDTNNGEYHGPCPYCKDGQDRFWVTPNPDESNVGLYYCRQCRKGGQVPGLIRFLGGVTVNTFKPSWSAPKKKNSKKPPSKEWQDCLKKNIALYSTSPAAIEAYRRRGIFATTITELGLSANFAFRKIKTNSEGERVYFPEGLVIPNLRKDVLYGVEIRTFNNKYGKYQAVKGSIKVPYHYTKLSAKDAPVMVVESALDAAILYQEAGDKIQIIALGSVSNKPDPYIKTILSRASRIIVCLDYDVPGHEAAKWWKENYSQAEIIYSPLGKDIGDFHIGGGSVKSWVEGLLSGSATPKRITPELDSVLIDEPEAAQNLLHQITDNELVPGVAISENYLCLALDRQCFALDLNKIPGETLKHLESMSIITHDGVDLIQEMFRYGVSLTNIESTSIQFSVISGMEKDLETLAHFRLGYGSKHIEEEIHRTLMQAHLAWSIYNIQAAKIEKFKRAKSYRLFAGAQLAVAQIRSGGFYFNVEKHKELTRQWQLDLDSLPADDPGLSSLTHTLTTYGEKFLRHYDQDTGRIYPDFNFTFSNTGRFSCKEPNLLGIPKNELRQVFCAPEGRTLVGADYSQIDLRVGAMISNDHAMIEAFREGTDFHKLTAAAIYDIPIAEVSQEQRQAAKVINYSVVYGGGGRQVKAARERLHSAFPGFYTWLARQQKTARSAYQVKTPSGRMILWDLYSKNWTKQSCNYPIQAGSAEVMLAALAKLPALIETLDGKITLCVHDEIILEIAECDAEAARKALVTSMEQGFLQIFPDGPVTGLVDSKIGKTWYDIK